jgi:hypothetical protein
VGRKADGWLPSLGVLIRQGLRAGDDQIDAPAGKAARDPGSIGWITNVKGVIGERPAPARSELSVGCLAGERLDGSVDWWVETLAGFADDGDTLFSGRWTPRPARSSCSPTRLYRASAGLADRSDCSAQSR